MNANDSRNLDAHLHELLTGKKSWLHGTIDISRTLAEVLDWVVSDDAHPGFVHGVPHYTTDENIIRSAELALAPELREDYADEVFDIVEQRTDGTGIIYALITATAHQRALALVAVLERVRVPSSNPPSS